MSSTWIAYTLDIIYVKNQLLLFAVLYKYVYFTNNYNNLTSAGRNIVTKVLYNKLLSQYILSNIILLPHYSDIMVRYWIIRLHYNAIIFWKKKKLSYTKKLLIEPLRLLANRSCVDKPLLWAGEGCFSAFLCINFILGLDHFNLKKLKRKYCQIFWDDVTQNIMDLTAELLRTKQDQQQQQ